MNISVRAGGMFSIFHHFIDKIQIINDPEKRYRLLVAPAEKKKTPGIFDSVFDFKDIDDSKETIYHTAHDSYLRANISNNFDAYRKICSKLKFQPSILEAVQSYVEKYHIGSTTLGVHIRLTDMNVIHSEYGVFTIEDYIRTVRDYLTQHKDITNIYVASDNLESIELFRKEFGDYDICFLEDSTRVQYEKDDNFTHQLDEFNSPEFFQKNAIESLVLSKCGALVHRVSDFANFAMLFSTSFRDIICLN